MTFAATPPSMSTIGAFGTPSMSKPRASVRGCAGVSESVIAGAATRVPSRSDERAAALGVGEPVVGEIGEELEQHADGLGLEHDGVGARAELGERLPRDLARRAPRERLGVERGGGRRRVGRRSRCGRRGRGR